MWITDVDRVGIVWANASALEIWLADSLEELVARDTSATSETARTTLQHVRERAFSGARVRSQRTIYPRGRARLLEMAVGPYTLPDGRGALLVEGTLLDQATIDADVLRGSEAARYAPICICTLSLSGDVLTQNATVTRAFGSSFTLASLEGGSATVQAWLDRLQRDQDVQVQVELQTLAGKRWYDLQLRPWPDPLTGGRAALLTAVDMTEHRALDQLKSEFVAMVSHELSAPLAAVVGFLDLLRQGGGGPLHPPGRELVQLGLDNAKRLEQLVADLLDVQSSITTGFTLAPARHDLAELAEQAVRLNRKLAMEHRVTVVRALSPEPLPAWVDARRMIQILTNLLSNAARYSPVGGTIDLLVRRRGQRARMTVSDRGPGVPDAFRSHIFEEFTRAEGTRADQPGLGLGLYICKALIEAQGGTIDYSSRPGQGSRFWVELPLVGDGDSPVPSG